MPSRTWIMITGVSIILIAGCGILEGRPTTEALSSTTEIGEPLLTTSTDVPPTPADLPPREVISVETTERIKRMTTLSGHEDRVIALAFSRNGEYFASSSRDGTIRLWDAQNGQELCVFMINEAVMNGIAFSPDGLLLASATAVWDVDSKEVVFFLETVRSGAVAYSPDGSRLAVAPMDHPIELWDVASGELIRTFEGHAHNVFFGVAFSPNGALLAAAEPEGIISVWDAENGRVVNSLEHGTPSDIHNVAFSPDGSLLASCSTDASIRLWDPASGQVVHKLWHWGGLMNLAFSPDGTIIASAGTDRSVCLWEVSSGRQLRCLSHADELMSVAFSPDGTYLISGGYDHLIYLWGIPR